MPYTVFQCIDLLTVTHLEYLILGMNNYINHQRQRTQLRRADLSLTKITEEEALRAVELEMFQLSSTIR